MPSGWRRPRAQVEDHCEAYAGDRSFLRQVDVKIFSGGEPLKVLRQVRNSWIVQLEKWYEMMAAKSPL